FWSKLRARPRPAHATRSVAAGFSGAAMTLATETRSASSTVVVEPLSTPPRVYSVDALRGFVMFTMLFVNDVAGVRHAPWWMKHYHPETANGMTFVDLVFPAFLFIVGLSIPLAFASRLRRGEPMWKLVLHVLARTGG